MSAPDANIDNASVVDAGSLKLRVEASPWRMHFVDAAGRPVLTESGDTGTGPVGALGLHIGPPAEGSGLLPLLPPIVRGQPAAPPLRENGWVRATELLDVRREGRAWIGTLATTSPLHTIELRAEPESDGVIRLSARPSLPMLVQAMGIGFDGAADERYYGFGERGNAVNQAGRTLEHYVGEGPYQNEEYLPIMAVVPKWGIRWREDASYFPIPWLLSSRGYGVLLDNDELSYHRLGFSRWSMEAENTELRFRVFAGPRPADALRRFSGAIGRQPQNVAPWFFGPWVQPDTVERMQQLRAADVPSSVTATYLHYLPCGDQQGVEEDERRAVRAYNALGTAVHTYFNPMICTDYAPAFAEAEARDALILDRSGQTYVYPYTTDELFTVSQFDFSTPNGVAAYGRLTDEAIADGHEGWMEDFGEYTPLDAVARSDGATGTAFHNRYAREYHCGVQVATEHHRRPLARFVRSGWTGSAACSPIVWGGDPSTTFGFDGLESSIYQALSMGTSGVGVWGSDIGGFFALGFTSLSPELLNRWIAFGGLSVIMRSQKNGIAIPAKSRPQLWDAAHLPVWRRYAKLHTQLYPYLRAALDEYYATGMPVMRHHILTHPQDPQAIARDDQYLFGPDLLVAPVHVEGASTRELYLPPGRWIEFWRAVDYVESNGDFVLRNNPAVVEGGRSITVNAPIEEIPIFVRAGARIPLLPADTYTLAEHGNDPGIVNLSERAAQVRILQFPD